MKTKTNKKVIIAVILLVISIIIFFKYTPVWAYKIVEKQAVNYLCDKYDAKKEEFELVDYAKPHIYFQSIGELMEKPIRVDYSFEYAYKERTFFVTKNEYEFYDDYQLDDLEIWCTKWLQNNIDERIIGITMSGLDIKYYEKNNNFKGKILSENDVESFLKDYFGRNDTIGVRIYCKVNDVNSIIANDIIARFDEERAIVKNIKSKITVNSTLGAVFIDTQVIKIYDRFEGNQWYCEFNEED